MYNVTLIATVHKERGRCNPEELSDLIEAIQPDVIFEEIAVPFHDAIYAGRMSDHVETAAIKRYLHRHNTPHIPVDLDGNTLVDKNIKQALDAMFAFFGSIADHHDVASEVNRLSADEGFNFLNSDRCTTLFERRHALERSLVHLSNDQRLIRTYRYWLEVQALREKTMIQNIYAYSRSHPFEHALFLVGAEHRKPILERVTGLSPNDYPVLNWTTHCFD